MYIIGYDIGSSSVKASLIKAETGDVVSSAFYPKEEMLITAKMRGWAEQISAKQELYESIINQYM